MQFLTDLKVKRMPQNGKPLWIVLAVQCDSNNNVKAAQEFAGTNLPQAMALFQHWQQKQFETAVAA